MVLLSISPLHCPSPPPVFAELPTIRLSRTKLPGGDTLAKKIEHTPEAAHIEDAGGHDLDCMSDFER